MAKKDDVELFLRRLDIIDRRYGIILSTDFKSKKKQSTTAKTDLKSEPFDIFFDGNFTERKAKSIIKMVQNLCKKTLSERREKVVATTLRADRTFFHKAIRHHYQGKFLAIYCRDRYNKNANYSHIAVRLLDISAKEKQAYFDSEKKRLEVMTTGSGGATGAGGRTLFVICNPEQYVKRGLTLLNSKQPDDRKRFINMILGLMCLTGRRATEVLLMTVRVASLTPIKNRDNVMLFHGQLKNEQALKPVDDYHIFTLVNSKLIASKINELQEMVKNKNCNTLPILNKLDFSNYDNDDFVKLEINDRLNRALGKRKKDDEDRGNILGLAAKNALFGHFLGITTDGNINNAIPTNPDDFKAKQLRAIYVLLCHKYFVHDKHKSKELNNFGFQLLGHTKGGAIDHYTNYRIKNVPIG